MKKTGYLPTSQEIDSLYRQASEGDAAALEKLGQMNNQISKRANVKLRDMRDKNMGNVPSVKRADYWLGEQGRSAFNQGKRLDVDDLYDNLNQASQFLRSEYQSSFADRHKMGDLLDKLDAKGFFAGVSEEDLPDVQEKLLEMFDSNAWQDMRKHIGGTNLLVSEAVEAIQGGALLGDLKRAFQSYKADTLNTDYIELWDQWKSADSYFKGGNWKKLKSKRR